MKASSFEERGERLAALMQCVGFAVWQLQELETTVATYVVIRLHSSVGIGASEGERLLRQAEGRTLGSLLTELAKSGLIADNLATELREALEQRNWLIHRARRECRGVLDHLEMLQRLVEKLDALADRALRLQKTIAVEGERYVLSCGVDVHSIDREAERLARSWALLD